MYESYFGFSSKPFSISPDPNCIYFNSNYREASVLLHYGIYECKGIACLVGEVGTGKTMLLNQLIGSLEENVTAIPIPLSRFTLDEIVIYLLRKIGIKDDFTESGSRLDALYEHLKTQTLEHGKTFVILVDEAQNLSNETLENLRLLSNLEIPSKKLLHILLVGQPELRAKLNVPELRQFKQRIAVNYTLMPLASEEVPKFIEYRLASAGYHGLRLFTDEAIELIASFSGGIPRLINTLCNNALMIAFAEDKRNVNANHVKAAAKDLLLDDSEPAADLSPESEDTVVPEDTVVDFSSTIVGEDEESDFRNLQDQHRTAKTHMSRRWVAIATIALALGLGFLFTGNSNPNRTGSALDFVDHLWQDVGNKINQLKDSLSGNESHEDDSAGLPSTQRGDLPAATERVANNDGTNDFEPVPSESLQRPAEELANVALVYESESVDLSATDSPILPVTTAEKDTSPTTGTETRAQPYLDEGETHTKQPDSPRSPEAQLGTPTTLGKALDTHTPPTEHAPAADPVNAEDDLAEETGSEYAPNPGESGVPPVTSTELDSRQAVLEAADTQINQSSQAQSVSRPNARTILGAKTHIVKNGETISDLANELYGRSGLYQMISVQISNPELVDLNVIFEDQEIDFPQLFSDIMVFTDGEGSHGALIGTTRSLSKATKWQSEISSRENNPAVIKTMQLPDNTDVYLVEITGYPNPKSLVSEINNEPTLRKIFSESMYESL